MALRWLITLASFTSACNLTRAASAAHSSPSRQALHILDSAVLRSSPEPVEDSPEASLQSAMNDDAGLRPRISPPPTSPLNSNGIITKSKRRSDGETRAKKDGFQNRVDTKNDDAKFDTHKLERSTLSGDEGRHSSIGEYDSSVSAEALPIEHGSFHSCSAG